MHLGPMSDQSLTKMIIISEIRKKNEAVQIAGTRSYGKNITLLALDTELA